MYLCICVLRVLIVHIYMIFLLKFETIPPLWYTLFFILSANKTDSSWGGVLNTILCDLRQVGGFFRVLRFPPPIKLTATIYLKCC